MAYVKTGGSALWAGLGGIVPLVGLVILLVVGMPTTWVHLPPDLGGKPSPKLSAWLESHHSFVESTIGRFVRTLVGGVGSLAKGLAVLAMIGIFALWYDPPGRAGPPPGSTGEKFLIGMGLTLIIAIALGVHEFGRRLANESAQERLRRDRRSPILLLRSFSDDKMRVRGRSVGLTSPDAVADTTSLEEIITRVFGELGPVVAIGRPGEFLRPTGAGRVWLKHEDWTEWVLDLLAWSQRVVMVLGVPRKEGLAADPRKEGLAWEIEQIFSTPTPQKIVLILPPQLRSEEIRQRWELYQNLLPGRLPDLPAYSVIVRFAADGSAILHRYGDPNGCQTDEARRSSFEFALESVRDGQDGTEVLSSPTASHP